MNKLYTLFVGACVAAASCFSSHAKCVSAWWFTPREALLLVTG